LIENATVTRSTTPSSVLAEHAEKRHIWDNTEKKRQVEKQAQYKELELKKQFKQDIAQANRIYKEGLEQCMQEKEARIQELNNDVPESTILAIGIAKISKALRKMKNGDAEKKDLEAN